MRILVSVIHNEITFNIYVINCYNLTIWVLARRSTTSMNLKPTSASISSQRLNSTNTRSVGSGSGGGGRGSGTLRCSGGGDQSMTQYALMDDENVSALQQLTKGGGAVTLASQWKSPFDDSEDTTDNEWKQDGQVRIIYIYICHIYFMLYMFLYYRVQSIKEINQ